MNWDAVGAIAETVGGIGVILTLFYLALQIRGSNRVATAQSRQSMTEFAMGITRFRAEHADRYARIAAGEVLTPGDQEFLYWSHLQMLTYGEAYHQQFQLGLMPDSHWEGFSNWIEDYVKSRDFEPFWESERGNFSAEYSTWIDQKLGA
ncbi:MAG: hypothetical protein ACPG1A_12040 [Halioglobus sp.]